MYMKVLGCASIMLVLGAVASAQTPVGELDIDSGWVDWVLLNPRTSS